MKINRKSIVAALSAILLLSVIGTSASAAQVQGVSVIVDGKDVKFPDGKPYTEDSRVMIPVRFVSEALGADVKYKKETAGSKVNRVVTIILNNKNIKMNVNSDTVLVGDKVVKLDVPARLQEERVFVPIRFVSEALGATVGWNQAKRVVSITTGKEIIPPEAESNIDAYGSFDWKEGYTNLAQQLFANNMKVTNGKLIFTVPNGAQGDYESSNGAMTPFKAGKSYSYSLTDRGAISIALIYPGKTELEGYRIYFPGSYVDPENNPKLAAAIENMGVNDVIVFTHKIDGQEVAGTLSVVSKQANQLK